MDFKEKIAPGITVSGSGSWGDADEEVKVAETDEKVNAGTARVIIEVVAGLLPGTPMPGYTKRWAITSEEWAEAGRQLGQDQIETHGHQMTLLAERVGQAQGYAALLMTSPNQVNWVRTDWIWL